LATESGGPIFLHSSWRSASTWLWERFRRVPTTLAYYEIFHEDLAVWTAADLLRMSPTAWDARHPHTAPYFLEFVPLIGESGTIQNFDRRMAIDQFIPSDGLRGSISEAEAVYVASLIAHARNSARVPVLADCRTLGRVLGLRERFGGVHIFLYRNIFHQWASYSEFAYRGNPYFFNTVKLIIDRNHHDPFLAYLGQTYKLGSPDVRSEDYFLGFALLHIYLYASVFDLADVVVDANKLSASDRYRETLEKRIVELTNLEIDLSASSSTFSLSFLKPKDSTRLRVQINEGLARILSLLKPTEAAARWTAELVQELFLAFETHKFFAGQAMQQLEACAAQAEGFRTVRNLLFDQRQKLLRERDSLWNKH
jgi:hypothetical protein